MKKEKKINIIQRYQPDQNGLSLLQVKQRQADKLVNKVKQKSSKSVFKIIFDNVVTFFNLIWLLIFIALMAVQSYSNLLFVVVVCLNTLISIVQEIKAKITVEKLKLITSPRVDVIREGKVQQIFANQLVLDDIVKLSIGNQVPSDCIVQSGEIEVNESLLTGESKPVKKHQGDTLLAGSFLTSGSCIVRIDKVGKDNYIQTVATQAKTFKSPSSNLFKDLNTIIKYIGIMIIPVGGLMFVSNYFGCNRDFARAIELTCGSLIGMVPAGMFLLITIALAVGVVKLAQKKTLVQDLYSIEMLARANVLCLDKTGTITDGTMQVKELLALKEVDFNLNGVLANHLANQSTTNSTSRAMIQFFGTDSNTKATEKIEFSSERKFSASYFKNIGTIAVGAPEFMGIKLKQSLKNKIKKYMAKGERVLIVGHSKNRIAGDKFPELEPVALLVIEDHIRDDAIATIEWFKQNGVEIKIISGDDPATVGAIARRIGVKDSDKTISLDGMSIDEVKKIADKFTVFGRVSPEQKHALIKELKNSGKVVAMTGDGVNDTLALKEADCSISMADGSDVARNLSHLVLMDSKFSSLPAVVKEGRQVVNNVQQSSSLYLMKTFFTIALSLITIITMSTYPFKPKQLYILEMLIIGLPSVILALQPNDQMIQGNFIKQVLKNSIPYGMLLLANILAIKALYRLSFFTAEEFTTIGTMILYTIGYLNLLRLCLPLTKIRGACLAISFVLILALNLIMPEFFGMTAFTLRVIMTLLCCAVASSILLFIVPWLIKLSKRKKHKRQAQAQSK